MSAIEITGLVGAILLGGCAVPQALYTLKSKDASGLSWPFLWMWGVGEILLLIYVLGTGRDWILVGNYALNLMCLFAMLSVKIAGSAKK